MPTPAAVLRCAIGALARARRDRAELPAILRVRGQLGARGIDGPIRSRKAFPAARCKPLEWKSDAAERRCDDARSALAGAEVRVTFYLKGDAVRAFSVRFDSKDLERVAAQLRVQYGAPLAEATEAIARPGREDRRVYETRWEKGAAHAVLSAQLNRKRAELEAWRGDFDTAIYRVR